MEKNIVGSFSSLYPLEIFYELNARYLYATSFQLKI